MGKYALGNPKNNWSDRFWDVKDGDLVHVAWQDMYEDNEIERQTKECRIYEVVKKWTELLDSEWVHWRLRDLQTGEERYARLNADWDNHRGYARKLTPEEVEMARKDPAVQLPEAEGPPHSLKIDYKVPFDTQGGKYPRPAKPRPFHDPEAGKTYRMLNFREGEYMYDVVVQGIELWGTGKPRAVAYKRVGSDTVERRTVEYFKFNFHVQRDA